MSALVFDIETVPDTTIWQPPGPEPAKLKDEKKPGKADLSFLDDVLTRDLVKLHQVDLTKAKDIAERAEKPDAVEKVTAALAVVAPEDDPFPPLYAHRVICVAGVLFADDYSVKWMGVAPAPTAEYEKPLLSSWGSFLSSERPEIVTWNGRAFDVPVIMLRSFHHGVVHGWYHRDYQNRYNGAHLDLCDTMSEYGHKGIKLDAAARLIGLPGKMGVDGSKVAALYAAGQMDTISAYCYTDVIQTAFVLLRFRLTRGLLSPDVYRTAVLGLIERAKVATPELIERTNLQALTL